MRFAAGITLYDPTYQELKQIAKYGNSFDKIIIFDNSESDYGKLKFLFDDNFTILSKGENLGLSVAFNSIIKYLENEEIDYLCTLDQDSEFRKEDISRIQKFLENTTNDNIGVIGPYIDYGFGQHRYKRKIEKKPWVITSGSFINLNIVRKNNMYYDENYFIDKFEIDLCQQMINANYEVLMYHDSILHQNLGEKSGHKHPNHSPLRHYYLFRNRFYFNKKWFGRGKCIILDILQTIKHLGLIVLYEKDKWSKVKMLLIALVDFEKGKMGKYEKNINI